MQRRKYLQRCKYLQLCKYLQHRKYVQPHKYLQRCNYVLCPKYPQCYSTSFWEIKHLWNLHNFVGVFGTPHKIFNNNGESAKIYNKLCKNKLSSGHQVTRKAREERNYHNGWHMCKKVHKKVTIKSTRNTSQKSSFARKSSQ